MYQHDDNARLIKEVDAGGGEYLKTYDDKGRLVSEEIIKTPKIVD